MGVKWTEDQQKVISLRDRSILVSAAAGSGKTAVLVQRILGMIMDPIHPVDIDHLLIMTFTRAAAGEMKERISRALEQALFEDPDNEHLQRQMTLIHTAQITTIDGFCSYVIRNYFHLIGLDPGYRTADEGEMKLLKQDVLKTLLEDFYAKEEETYTHFVECFCPGKSDDGLKDLILKMYDTAMSSPYPLEWLDTCMDSYKISDINEIKHQEWMKLLWNCVREQLKEALMLNEGAKMICLHPDGPYYYEDAINSDRLTILALLDAAGREDFDEMAGLLDGLSYARLSVKKDADVLESKKEQVKALREEEKGILKDISTRYFSCSVQEEVEIMKCCRKPLEVLVDLTREFIERFGQQKREKNILDFTDMEHFALEILMEKDGDKVHMSQAARELSLKYEEVFVDEYQDSNLVQEYITGCVSGWVKNRKNTFMVGDVKQSIYRFRLARPELFMEKYKRFSKQDSEEQRIDLRKNFRSRPEVLASVNFLFRQIMGEDLGDISYDEDAALYPGASFPEGQREEFVKTEVLLVEKDGPELIDETELKNAQELEALAVAHKIRDMVGVEKVLDKETGVYRPLEYGDIVILLRTFTGWAEVFSEVLSAQGIPSYTTSKTGYFSAVEVVTLLNYLRICDNPLQDIPMAGVLRSPIVGCTSQELAIIRSEYPKGMLYDSVCAYIGDGQMELFPGEDEKSRLKEKLMDFMEQLMEIRTLAAYTPVHELIILILERTGYGKYARALPDGEPRSANLSMLVEKAMEYEKTSYRGLFNFVRYVEQLQKFEVDYGEVNLTGAGQGSVQIMTIHKSKGLEFPVVFAAGMGKQFNFQDVNAGLVVHPDLGIGTDAVLPEKRIVTASLHKQMLRRQLLQENLGEEIRVLYVALTRAKEKLILTGTIGKLEKQMMFLSRFLSREEELLPVETRVKAKNYWSYILPALARHRCMEGLFEEYGIMGNRKNPLYDDPAEFVVRKVTALELVGTEVVHQAGEEMRKEILKNWDPDQVYDADIREELKKRFEFSYSYGYLKDIPVKVSVSELKKRSYHEEYEIEESVCFEPDIVPLIPNFVEKKEEEYIGAARGTAYHRVMECLDYGNTDTDEALKLQIQKLLEQKKLRGEEAGCIRIRDLRRFLDGELGRRMRLAASDGKLFREQPFMISRKARDLEGQWDCEERVLVQGIIDAYFLEEDDIVLVDYKTDRVKKGEEQKLVELYHTQLEDYACALESVTGKKVKETYIYSFTLGEEIPL